MSRFATMTVLLIVFLVSGHAQQTAPSAHSQASAQRPTGSIPYDPMAGATRNGQPKGIVEAILAGVNSRNQDYGTEVKDWRKAIFESTVTRVDSWSIVLLCFALSVSLAGNCWFGRDRQRRLTISSSIVAQFYNAYINSRAKALEVIDRYNLLVERYNHVSEQAKDLKEKLAPQNKEGVQPGMQFEQIKREKIAESNLRSESRTPPDAELAGEKRSTNGDDLKTELKTLENALQKKEAQIQAKDNQLTNLRMRLSRAHDSLESLRTQKPGTQ